MPLRKSSQWMQPDPKRKRGGRCAQCGGPIQIVERPGIDYGLDPFCSSECCKKWHGVKVPGGPNPRESKTQVFNS